MFCVSMPRRARERLFRSGALLALLAAVLCGPSAARAADEPGRYTMTPTEEGALRLDTRTGAVSACSRVEGGGWACRAVADDRLELRKQVDRLAAENRTLSEEIERLKQLSRPAPRRQDEKAEGDHSWLPDQQDVERVMAYFQGMMRRFQAKLESLWEKVQQSGAESDSW